MSEQELQLHGETFEEWGKHQFECQYCDECGGDWYDHIGIPFLGNWFAYCKIGEDPNYKVKSREN